MNANIRHYLDHNASAPLLPEARAAMLDAITVTGNASSVHREGRRARAIVEEARRDIAALVGATAEGVVFTSGASEAATAVLSPLWRRDGQPVEVARLAVAETDHPCLQEGGRFGSARVERLAVDRNGYIRADVLERWLEGGRGVTSILAITLANNESGVVQPMAPIRAAIDGHDVVFVVDAVQAVGRLPVDLASLGADALILSGHKIGALMGIGALVLRDPEFCPAPLIVGGGQERRHRAGTEGVPAIASFGAAARVAAARSTQDIRRLSGLRARLEERLRAAGGVVIVGEGVERLPNTVLVAAPGLRAETAQIALDLQGVAVSAGSACASGKVGASPVLAAHARAGLDIDPAAGGVRVSFGYETGEDAIDAVAEALGALIRRAAPAEAGTRVA